MTQKSAVLHIGLHKTGSTTLQNALVANREYLRELRIFYPEHHLPSRTQQSHLALFLRTGQAEEYAVAASAILNDFVTGGYDRLVLSGEEFSTLRSELVRQVHASLAPYFGEMKIILYVRNLFQFMLSLIAQYSKAGDAIIYPQTAIARMRSFNPTDVLRRWEAVAGENNVTVMCLDRLPGGASIVENFAELADLPLVKPASDTAANRSMDAIASSLLSHLAFEFNIPEARFYRAYFAHLDKRVALPKTENYYCDLMQEWVQNVDLSHDKLKSFDAVMRERPGIDEAPNGNSMQLDDYVDFLSTVLRHVHRIGSGRK
jgi:hypothetical protein